MPDSQQQNSGLAYWESGWKSIHCEECRGSEQMTSWASRYSEKKHTANNKSLINQQRKNGISMGMRPSRSTVLFFNKSWFTLGTP